MATLASLRNLIAQKVQNPYLQGNISASVVDAEINRSIRYYQQERFFFNTSTASIELISGQQTVPSLPSNLLSPLYVNGLMLKDNQINIPLHKLLPDEFKMQDSQQIGRPAYYTYYKDAFELLPIPEQTYTLEFSYLKSYEDLKNDGDTNDFTLNVENLLMLNAVKNLYAENKDDPERSITYQRLEDMEYSKVKSRSNDYDSSGQLTVNSIL